MAGGSDDEEFQAGEEEEEAEWQDSEVCRPGARTDACCTAGDANAAVGARPGGPSAPRQSPLARCVQEGGSSESEEDVGRHRKKQPAKEKKKKRGKGFIDDAAEKVRPGPCLASGQVLGHEFKAWKLRLQRCGRSGSRSGACRRSAAAAAASQLPGPVPLHCFHG